MKRLVVLNEVLGAWQYLEVYMISRAEVFAIAGFYATLADLLVYTLGLTSCFALVAVMHLAGNGLVFERGFRDVFDL